MRKLIVSVQGMHCRRCVRQATALVRDVAGVRAVIADPGTGSVTVLGTMTAADVLTSLVATDFVTTVLEDDGVDRSRPVARRSQTP